MTRFAAALSIFVLSTAAACAQEDETAADPQQGEETFADTVTEAAEAVEEQVDEAVAGDGPSEASADLINRDRETIGQARFQQGPEGVLITVEIDGLPEGAAGWHGAHLHMIGDCSNDDFTSSGGHINPSGNQHGLLNPDGPDNADLPNLYVHDDGVLRAQAFTTRVSLDGRMGVPTLFDEDGSALVMHANSDDHTTQPIGGAGPRIVCGVIAEAGQ
jgi:Cu-Zn family superoxide dismutase